MAKDHSGTKASDEPGRIDGMPSIDLSDRESLDARTWQELPAGVSWTPERMEINGRKGRRVICVLAQDHFHYRIYDLDSSTETLATGTERSDEIMS